PACVREASQSDPWYSEVPVSDDKDLDRDKPDTPEAEAEAEADDLDELDELGDGDGFDRAVAEARGGLDPNLGERPYTEEEVGLRGRSGWGRSPIISVAVLVVGLFLL